MIVINLNTHSQLFLTQSEATDLALDLESQLITAANQIIIADVRLTIDEGERLLETLRNATQSVNWKVEGF